MNILIVDDKPANLLALRKILTKPELNIIEASSGNDALALLLKHDFALVLLDVQMPDMDGFEAAEIIRGNKETKSIPIIFVTAINKERKYIFEGYEKGAVDYLFKPLDPDILQCKVNVFLELHGQKEALKRTNNELQVSTQSFKCESKQFNITVSIGIAFSNDAESVNDLLAHADQALYQAKESGRNRIVIYKARENLLNKRILRG